MSKDSKDGDDKGRPGANRNMAKKMPMRKPPSAPKITFVGGTRLTLQGGVMKSEPTSAGQGAVSTTPSSTTSSQDGEGMDTDDGKVCLLFGRSVFLI